ncbi:hypothetical protein DIPPA_21607 [Diplonema papillatum]|nr:hypothetical protein DIPPA_21607 [Diplonema papillatum]
MDVLELIESTCRQVLATPDPTAALAQLALQQPVYDFLTQGNPNHDYFRWRLGELSNQAASQPTATELSEVEEAARRVASSADPASLEADLLQSGNFPFVKRPHALHDFYQWRLAVARAPPPPKRSGFLSVALDSKADGNHAVSIGQLMLLLAPLIEAGDCDPGIFVDPNGHVVIPANVFDEPQHAVQLRPVNPSNRGPIVTTVLPIAMLPAVLPIQHVEVPLPTPSTPPPGVDDTVITF